MDETFSPIQKMDMPVIRQNLSKLRQDWRSSSPESVFRISTVLSNGMSYAEFTLHFLLRNKKKPSDQTPIKGVRKKKRTHRLIAKAFIPNLENKLEVNHIDGDKLNNDIQNLEWCIHIRREYRIYY